METTDQKIKKYGAINGLLFGVIILVVTIFSFYFITTMAKSMLALVLGPIVFTILIPLGLAIFFCFDLRKKIGGFWNQRQATTGIFIMFIVAYAISTAGSLGFSTVIEPDMINKMENVFVNTTTEMMEKSGVDQEKIDKQVAEVQSRFDIQKERSIGKVLKDIGIAIIIDFVIALIFAAFFKREAPLYADNIDEQSLDPTV